MALSRRDFVRKIASITACYGALPVLGNMGDTYPSAAHGLRRGLGMRIGMMGGGATEKVPIAWIMSNSNGISTTVDTGVYVSNLDTLSASFVFLAKASYVFYNNAAWASATHVACWSGTSSGSIDIMFGGVNHSNNVDAINKDASIVLKNGNITRTINGATTSNSFAQKTFTSSTTMTLFHTGQIKLKSFSISGQHSISLIPVRIGSVGYFYDTLHPTGGPLGNGLYGNSKDNNNGFPSSLLGPDVVT